MFQLVSQFACCVQHSSYLNSLVLSLQGKYTEADIFYDRALTTIMTERGKRHVDCAATLNNWAGLMKAQVKPRRYGIYSPQTCSKQK